MLGKKSYLASRLTCGLGNSLYGLVFIWWLQVQSKSSTLVGFANAIFAVTAALSIFYGPFIDSHSYKKTSIYAMVTQVALTFLLSAAMAFLTHNYALALVLGGALSICDEFFNPADRAILKGTISNDAEMTGVISQVNMIDQVVSIAGTALSGVMLTLITSGQIILLCSGLSLLGLLLLMVAFRRVPTQNLHQESNQDSLSNYWQRVTSGYYYIKQNQFLNRYFWSSLLFSFATPAMMLILPRIAQKAGKPSLYSSFYIALMLGFILGALLSSRMVASARVIGLAWLISALPLGLMLIFSSNMVILITLIFFFAIVTSIHNVLGEAKEQTATADSYLGRVMTTIRTSTQIGGPLMSVVAGILLDHAGQNLLISGCTLLILLGGINMLLVKEG